MRSAAPLAALILASCQCSGEPRPPAVPATEGRTLPLSELPFAELAVPPDSRGGREPPASIPIDGPWRYSGTSRAGMHKYSAPLPIRPRGLFFHKAQPGMRLTTRDGAEVRYDRFGKNKGLMWVHDRTELVVYRSEREDPPRAGDFVLTYPKATARERALNQAWSGAAPERFAWTTITDGWDTRTGLLLPAPGVAAWDVDVPPSAELRFVSGLVEPEILDGPPSDGARLVVEVDAGGATEVVRTAHLAIRAFTPQTVDLARWAGQRVRVRVRTEPGDGATFDYAFLAEPVVASRVSDPVQVVMVFIDTLRPDRMSLFGYERDTTAALDAVEDELAVFTNARTVAPWTLPSARSIVTGRQPEYYSASPTVQELLRKEGFATGFFAGNVYLSQNFGMHRDWEFHRVGLWPPAEDTTDEALAWLDEHEGRHVLLQVHYMSTHLPYVEPKSYRTRYAGRMPDTLREGFQLSDIRKSNVGNDPEARQYVQDRYDNNVRYATDQVARILERLDDNDVLVLFADHGEEFWDHQGFEHGHSLYDELLRVPIVVKGPGVRAGSIDAPVSLLDLTPTILELAGAPLPAELDGRSLVPLLHGEPGADAPFRARDQAFGRPLYGDEQWGVLHGTTKWITTEGREKLFDLATDPVEKKNLLKGDAGSAEAYPGHLADALGREVSAGYRLVPTNHRGERPIPGLWALCTVPGGFAEAWRADDPLANSGATVTRLTDPAQIRAELDRYGFTSVVPPADSDAVQVCWHAGLFGSREVYLAPARPLGEVGADLVCAAYYGSAAGGKREILRVEAGRDPTLAGPRTPLGRVHLGGRQLALEFGIGPVPGEDVQPLEGRDAETDDMLEAMGYVDPEKGPDAEDHAPAPTALCEPPDDPRTPSGPATGATDR